MASALEKLKWRIGHTLWTQHSKDFERLNRGPLLADFVKSHRHVVTLEDRLALYHYVNRELLAEHPIDYLEFGVHDGTSLRTWLNIHPHPESRFFGFDSFEGLPEAWASNFPKGTFDLKGNLPTVSDTRAQLIPGWFQKSLPEFCRSFRPHHRLVVHNDSDLYTSTFYTLSRLDDLLIPATLLIFDEFCDPMNEFRAVQDYLQCYWRKWTLLAATPKFEQVVFEVNR